MSKNTSPKAESLGQVQVALAASEERFKLLVESVSDYAIFLLDPDGYVQSWNAGAERFKGYRAHEIIGKHFSTFYTPDDIQREHPKYELEVARATGRFEEEGWRQRKDGERFWANVVITRLLDSQGRLIGFAKVTRDLTERRQLEEQLRRNNEALDQRVKERTAQLESAVKARDEFMSIISHELKTPLTSLKLQAQTALRQMTKSNVPVEDRVSKFVTSADKQLDRLSRLIDDMLDISRISMDRLIMTMAPLDLGALVEEIIGRFAEQCELQGCVVTTNVQNTEGICGDAARLEQVVSNILLNAIKYGKGQPVHVSVEQLQDKALIVVKDNGMGIAPADQERVFERFERAISPRSVSGMGLGLYISRKIVEAHGGVVTVQSAIGQGATFTVALPVLSNKSEC